MKKKKHNLAQTLYHIERYRRRTLFAAHLTVSLVLQLVLWLNWYGSYAVRGLGFSGTFFTDRISVSIALLFALIAHFALMYWTEAKDRAVVRLLERYNEDDFDEEDESEAVLHLQDEEIEYRDLKRKH